MNLRKLIQETEKRQQDARIELARMRVDIGRELRKERLSKGLTLSETARHLGISAPFVYDLENGNRGIPPRLVDSLLGLFEKEIEGNKETT